MASTPLVGKIVLVLDKPEYSGLCTRGVVIMWRIRRIVRAYRSTPEKIHPLPPVTERAEDNNMNQFVDYFCAMQPQVDATKRLVQRDC